MMENIRRTQIFPITYIARGGEQVTEEFKVTELNAESGLKYMKKVQQLILPVWAEAMKAAKTLKQDVAAEEGEESQETTVAFADIILKISDRIKDMDEKDIMGLVCESLNYSPAKFNEAFRGKYFALMILLKEIIIFNFEDVFLALGLEKF